MPANSTPLEIELVSGVQWSVCIGVPGHAAPLFSHQQDRICATASIGKVLLLITVAQNLAAGTLQPSTRIGRRDAAPVADSGLWQHLGVDELPLADVCALVGATSDNRATNVLIELVGLAAVDRVSARLGLTSTGLHDIVRDDRGPEHPAALSTGTAAELVAVCTELASPRMLTPTVAETVIGWLSLNTDLSMVAGAFGLDPLAHAHLDRGVRLWNKTGTNIGVRCDIGSVTRGRQQVAYAVLANWEPSDGDDPVRDTVLDCMRTIGRHLDGWLREQRR